MASCWQARGLEHGRQEALDVAARDARAMFLLARSEMPGSVFPAFVDLPDAYGTASPVMAVTPAEEAR